MFERRSLPLALKRWMAVIINGVVRFALRLECNSRYGEPLNCVTLRP